MCGIVGYIGKKDAYPILIKGLHRLEYRGYDSAGVALLNNDNQINVYKTKGKVEDLERYAADKDLSGTVGIAHTRWATHGEPNDLNAHPHYSQSKTLAIIHNGIIENYANIKKDLTKRGFQFQSDTDTEVLVQLIEYVKEQNKVDLPHAVQLALSQVVGAYAIAIIEKNNPQQIVVARKSSPLVIGIGDNEFFIASDATPIVEYTNKVIYLDDEQVAVVNRKTGILVRTIKDAEATPVIKEIEMSLNELEKGGFPHFMLKEIYEQPKRIAEAIRGRINVKHDNVSLAGIIDNKDKFINARRILIVACGTSWHAGLIGEYLIEDLCRIPVEVEYASEFRYRNPIIYKDDIVIAISQSGETADTLAAVQLARQKGAFVYGICNVVGSSIPRNTDSGTYTHVGPEIGVASTKAFTAQVMVLSLMALTIARLKKTIEKEKYVSLIHELAEIPSKMEETIKSNENIKNIAPIFTYAKNFIYLGRGFNYPVALEGALKLKEISYIHAEGYPAAEMKHGPIALIDTEMPVVFIAPHQAMYEKTISNIEEVKARKGRVFSIVTKGDSIVKKLSDYSIAIPKTSEYFTPLLAVIPLQLLAYHIAIMKGCNVDQPRNLAKSVTVE
ncbi:MAG: glutamine--fructose-6-phosphate transaminase (isomerizing) [Paludibacteraceae bacterium]|nr:glutamine--fructose-6-phosphate transaminase (isomerizing) [Paludibacteraceae bacterium]